MRRWGRIVALSLLALLALVAVLLFTPLTDPDARSQAEPARSYAEAATRISAIKGAEASEDLIPEGKSLALLTGSQEETAVVIFHGYTSVPQQFRLVAEGYRKQGYNVWVPRLPYHGERDKMTEDFSKIDAALLREFADENLDIAQGLGKKVVVIGFSGGGSLGVWSSVARDDVDQSILISPVLHPQGVPLWADRPLARALRLSPVDVYRWWDPDLQEDNVEGYNFPRLSLKGLGAMLSLTHWAEKQGKGGATPAKSDVLLIRNDGDQRLDSGYNEQFANRLASPEDLQVYRIPKSAGLLHNFISPEPFSEGYANIAVSYKYLSEALGIPMPDPLANR